MRAKRVITDTGWRWTVFTTTMRRAALHGEYAKRLLPRSVDEGEEMKKVKKDWDRDYKPSPSIRALLSKLRSMTPRERARYLRKRAKDPNLALFQAGQP
jgi:hypothetical protein